MNEGMGLDFGAGAEPFESMPTEANLLEGTGTQPKQSALSFSTRMVRGDRKTKSHVIFASA
ncbi:hypothetical protein RRSWK_04226 [Rhodopirellula sp. SWK7]|nr:hypothetical protein RRSWK_04226 [Rhodopirellula sp. SWK7]